MKSAPPSPGERELAELLTAFATPPGRRVPATQTELAAGATLARGALDLVVITTLDDRSRAAVTLRTARLALGRRGRIVIALRCDALAWIFVELARASLVAKRSQMVHRSLLAPAIAWFVEAQTGKPGGLVVEAPLVVPDPSANAGRLGRK